MELWGSQPQVMGRSTQSCGEVNPKLWGDQPKVVWIAQPNLWGGCDYRERKFSSVIAVAIATLSDSLPSRSAG